MNILYKSLQMPKEFMDAVEVIMKYCQNEDCDEDCKNCSCTLAEIRCGDTEESGYVKREHVVEIIDERIGKYNYKTNRLEITEGEDKKEMNIKDINFAIDILMHPQSGDESDINFALNTAIEALKTCKEVLEQAESEDNE